PNSWHRPARGCSTCRRFWSATAPPSRAAGWSTRLVSSPSRRRPMAPRTMRAILVGVKTNELLTPGWDAVRTARSFLIERFALSAAEADLCVVVLTDQIEPVRKAQLTQALAAAARALTG